VFNHFHFLLIQLYSGGMHFTFSIDNHKLKIIEVEGDYVKPHTVEKLPINIAQRYSVIVEANQPIKNYWMRATINRCFANNSETINANSAINFNAVGILKYEGADDNEPTTNESNESQPDPCADVPTKFLIPLNEKRVPGPVYKTFKMNISLGANEDEVPAGFINGNSFSPDFHDPTLHKILNEVDPQKLPSDQTPFIYDKPNGVIEIRLFNPGGAQHPFHLHGHSFQILGIGKGSKVDESQLNFKNPTRRDTVTAPAGSWVVIRFVADNPGIWAFHCHIEVST